MPVKIKKYKREIYDCDDFAREFWASLKLFFPTFAVGYCHVKTNKGEKHAANFVLYKTKSGKISFNFIEPQTGELKYFDWKPYLLIL